jgi:hypothetical protein
LKGEILILLIAPVCDLPTLLSGTAGADMNKWFIQNNFDVTTLIGAEATRLEMNPVLARNPACVCYYGHGVDDTLEGEIPPGDLISTDNINQFQGTIIVAIACDTGLTLGPQAIANGIETYFGAVDVINVAFPELEHDYLSDFSDVFTTIPIALLSGKTAEQALQAYVDRCNYYIGIYQANPGWSLSEWYMQALEHNRDVFRLFGNADAKLAEAQQIPQSNKALEDILRIGAAVGTGIAIGAGVIAGLTRLQGGK